ncbi:MAG: SMC-Scp complex subunit ScpB, partial [Erysipelotrichaceae bacterium]
MNHNNEIQECIENIQESEITQGCCTINKSQESTLTTSSIIEGLLFVVGDEGINVDQLEIVLEKNEEEIITILDALILKYQELVYPFELVCYGGRYKFLSKT